MAEHCTARQEITFVVSSVSPLVLSTYDNLTLVSACSCFHYISTHMKHISGNLMKIIHFYSNQCLNPD